MRRTRSARCAEGSDRWRACGLPLAGAAALGSGSVTATLLNARCSGTASQASVVQARIAGVNITAASSTCTDGATSSSLATVNGQVIATVIIAQARCRALQPVVSESRVALLLPLSAAALFGEAILLVRRRGATPPASWTLKPGGFFGNRRSSV